MTMEPTPVVHSVVHPHPSGNVLILTIDNPPVNASSAAVRSGLLDGIQRLTIESDLVAAVILGARGTFISGSDITEFDGPVPEPLLPTLIAAIESCPRPVVAAVDGFALGGGLELALGCDYRIGSKAARFAMPEVSLGMVPGAGGTQRLPRLVGPEVAVQLILSGRRISSTEALQLDLLDEVAAGDLIQQAVAAAVRCPKRRTSELPVPPGDPTAFATAVELGLRKAKHRPNALDAVELVQMASSMPIEDALAEERARFDRLRTSAEAIALRHIFFAERATVRRGGIRPSSTPVQRTAVIGAGAMGAGIAAALATAGAEVTLVDVDADQARQGCERAGRSIQKGVARGLIDAEVGAQAIGALRASSRIEDLADVELVIEAVFEDKAIKVEVLRTIQTVAPKAILATNTSYLGVQGIGDALADPSCLLGLHFFNPADIMRLVEIIPTTHTQPTAIATVVRLIADMNKQGVFAGDHEGFIGNRLFAAYRRHAEYLLEDGCLPADIDAALEGFGFAMGPFAVADLSGLQIAKSLRERWKREGRLPARYVDVPDLLCEHGRLGRRTSAGYYSYDANGARVVDSSVNELIESESERKGITRRSISADEIIHRTIGAMILEGCRASADGTAMHMDDIDVVMINGFGFPRHHGGPMHWARQQPKAVLEDLVRVVASAAHEPEESALVATILGTA